MASLLVRLLDRPAIERDGRERPPPRGRKAWAVLAYVALAERPVSRDRLAALLFRDAADPLGALRWTLSELRRVLGEPDALRGDPLVLGLPADAVVDALAVSGPSPSPDLVRGELLEGIELGMGTAFDTWLLVERRRIGGACDALLHDAALSALAAGRPGEGAELASRGLALSPFDETLHELLVRCLARAGDVRAARAHVAAYGSLFERELGRSPDPRVARAAGAADDLMDGAVGDRAVALAQLQAGRAAIDSGAVEPGVACLRLATAEARACGDQATQAQCLAELGTALVHAVRGRDEEGASLLHEALSLADSLDQRERVVEVCRELGFVEIQAGRATSAARWLTRATAVATGDEERCGVLGVRGMALSDRAYYEAATTLLRDSIAAAERCGRPRQAAWSLALLGRARLLCGATDEAAEVLDRSLALIDAEAWAAFKPFPETLRAEAALAHGDAEFAAPLIDHAFSLGCRLGDPCWEGMAARARGLLLAAGGDAEGACATLRDAAARATRVPDPYTWVHAYVLDALAAAERSAGDTAAAATTVDELGSIASRCDMRELAARAELHRAHLGNPRAMDAARLLAEGIDNPLLERELDAAVAA